MKVNNVLIFPAGSEIALEIFQALKLSKFVKVFGATSADDHSSLVYERLVNDLPYIRQEGFISALNVVIDKYQIDYVYPAYDEAQTYLMENEDALHAKVVSAPYETVRICRSKKETYSFFNGQRFIPKTYKSCDEVDHYPVFVKPSKGQGSQGAKIISNLEDLRLALQAEGDLVICEYLPGDEYTVDCFTGKDGVLLSAKMRVRERIKAGIAVRSKIVDMPPEVLAVAKQINKSLTFRGAWFFQIKKNIVGEFKLLEISPRIPGTMGLSRNLGINYPLLTLFLMDGYEIAVDSNDYGITVDRALYSAYQLDIKYERVYLDFDDTLIINGKVNTLLMSFIYQLLNEEKEIILLTKHKTDILLDLEKYRIDKNIFSKIILIAPTDEKSNYIDAKDAIFIDDSFQERKKVKEKFKIPVFDVDMVESLINWRM